MGILGFLDRIPAAWPIAMTTGKRQCIIQCITIHLQLYLADAQLEFNIHLHATMCRSGGAISSWVPIGSTNPYSSMLKTDRIHFEHNSNLFAPMKRLIFLGWVGLLHALLLRLKWKWVRFYKRSMCLSSCFSILRSILSFDVYNKCYLFIYRKFLTIVFIYSFFGLFIYYGPLNVSTWCIRP